MPAYNTADFDPPAPVALVSFIDPTSGQRIDDVPMLLDTGADAAVVPRAVIQALNVAERSPAFDVEYLEGGAATFSSVHLQMKWAGRDFTGEFLVARSEYGVIGRNILNHIRLVLDGPVLQWEAR